MAVFVLGTVFLAGPQAAGSTQGGGWSDPVKLFGGIAADVSCTSSHFCVEVNFRGTGFWYDGTRWHRFGKIDTTEDPSLVSVSCTSRRFCVAVNYAGQGSPLNRSRFGP